MNIHVFVKHVLQITCPTGPPSSDHLSFWSPVLLILELSRMAASVCEMLVRTLSFASNRFQSLLRRQKSHEATGPPTFGFSWVFTCRAAVWLLSNLIGGLFFGSFLFSSLALWLLWLFGLLSSRLRIICFSLLLFLVSTPVRGHERVDILGVGAGGGVGGGWRGVGC